MAMVSQKHTLTAEAQLALMRKALQAVEEWWLTREMHKHTAAPYCIFAVREALGPYRVPDGIGGERDTGLGAPLESARKK